MIFLSYITFVVMGITQMEPVAVVGLPEDCYKTGIVAAPLRAAELKIPLKDIKLGCRQFTPPY